MKFTALIGMNSTLLRRYLVYIVSLFALILIILLYAPGLPPHNVQFTAYDLPPTKKLQGPLKLNDRLNGAERLFENLIKGPESLVYGDGVLYTGVHGGLVLKIVNQQLIPFVKFGKSCDGIHEEDICGRPLGLHYDSPSKLLYVTDAYYGLFKVNVTTGEVVQLVDTDTDIEGKKAKLFNSVSVASDGMVYWTDSDTNFDLKNLIFSMLADGSGRLIRYNPHDQTNTVLLDGLFFANGVALSNDESFLLVAETVKFRVLRYYLKGPKKGSFDVFIDGLPGSPDNLKFDDSGNVYVSLVIARDDEITPSVVRNIGRYPSLRKVVARILAITQYTFNSIHNLWPHVVFKKIAHAIGHCETFISLIPQIKRVTIIKLNQDGHILESLHSTDGRISGICEIEFVNDYVYLASPFNHYLARVNLKESFA